MTYHEMEVCNYKTVDKGIYNNNNESQSSIMLIEKKSGTTEYILNDSISRMFQGISKVMYGDRSQNENK